VNRDRTKSDDLIAMKDSDVLAVGRALQERREIAARLRWRKRFHASILRRYSEQFKRPNRQRVIALMQRVENSTDGRDRLRLMPFALAQNPQRLQHIALIIRTRLTGYLELAEALGVNRDFMTASMAPFANRTRRQRDLVQPRV
jgi:hypothetical protein